MDQFVDGAYLRAFGAAGSVSFADEQLREAKRKHIYLIKGARGALCAQLLGGIRRILRDTEDSPARVFSPRRQALTEGLILP